MVKTTEGGKHDLFRYSEKWLREITEIGLLLVALGIVLQLLFGKAVAFITGDVVTNMIALIQALGDNGVVGLIALVVIIWLFSKRVPA